MNSTRNVAAQKNRGHDYKFWSGFPSFGDFPDMNVGVLFDEECVVPPVMASNTAAYGYHSYQDTGGVIRPLDTYPGGVWEMTSDGTDEDELWLQAGGVTGGMYHFSSTSDYNNDQYWETRIQVDRITANAVGFWFGLCEKASAVADHLVDATGALQTARALVGFHCAASAPQTIQAVYNSASGTVTDLGDAGTLVVDTWYRLGLKYKRSTGNLEYWVQGIKKFEVAISASNFPDGVNLTPMWGFKSTTATATTVRIDGWTYGLLWRN